MDYLESIPQRLVTLYLPLGVFVFVLLFPFYWMTITAFKSNEELLNFRDFNPLWVANPTLANVRKLFFDTQYPSVALEHDADRGRRDVPVALLRSVRRLRDRAHPL